MRIIMIIEKKYFDAEEIKKANAMNDKTMAPLRKIRLATMAIVGYVFYLMTIVISESYRMAQYFSLFTIILVPNTLVYIKNKKMRYIIYLIIVLFGIKHFFGGLFVEGGVYNPYVFYWQATQRLY